MLTTLPTGRIDGSDAAIPLRTPTPDAVVVPLQYAVAVNSSRAPAPGNVGSRSAEPTPRRSNMLTSYINTKPTMAITVTTSFRPSDREMSGRAIIGNAGTLRAAAVHGRRC